jgi:hypothetical protein
MAVRLGPDESLSKGITAKINHPELLPTSPNIRTGRFKYPMEMIFIPLILPYPQHTNPLTNPFSFVLSLQILIFWYKI